MPDEYPRATVREIDDPSVSPLDRVAAVLEGKEAPKVLVLDDPDALAVMRVVAKHNCRGDFEAQADRVAHFTRRIKERGLSPSGVVIVLLRVDDPHGGMLAEALMPGHNWQEYRDRGEIPFARGLAGREGIQEVLDLFDKEAGDKLRGMPGIAVVVVDHDVAEVFEPAVVQA